MGSPTQTQAKRNLAVELGILSPQGVNLEVIGVNDGHTEADEHDGVHGGEDV